MTKQENIEAKEAAPVTGLALLREPFPANQISKLPKPTAYQTKSLKEAQERKDFSLGVRCKICGGWHHKDVVHLDYVGHAALTDRLLEADPQWNWEPVAVTDDGTPKFDALGGMWIKLTVCGVTRLGYGHAEGKKGGDAIKELIGDALRNAAMRFGAALDLWHKGDLHGAGEEAEIEPDENDRGKADDEARLATQISDAKGQLESAASLEELRETWATLPKPVQHQATVIAAKDARKAALEKPAQDADAHPPIDDEIKY